MTLAVIWNTILATIQSTGYGTFGIIVVVDILLWRIHPVLGILATLLTFAFLLHWI